MVDAVDALRRDWADYGAALVGDDREAYATLWHRIENLGDALGESGGEVGTDDLILGALLSQEAELRRLRDKVKG